MGKKGKQRAGALESSYRSKAVYVFTFTTPKTMAEQYS